jgi:hypothetical protein
MHMLDLFLTMPKSVFFSIVILLSFSCGRAQKTAEEDYASASSKKENVQPKTPFRDRLVFGGNFGGAFGTTTFFQVNPMIGYRTTDWWVNGIGLNYFYFSQGGIAQSNYGASLWSRAYIAKTFIAHTEFEMLRREAADSFGNSFSVNVPVWLVGAGYNSGGRFGLSAMIMYDLIQDPNSPYSNPIFRVGGLFGF